MVTNEVMVETLLVISTPPFYTAARPGARSTHTRPQYLLLISLEKMGEVINTLGFRDWSADAESDGLVRWVNIGTSNGDGDGEQR